MKTEPLEKLYKVSIEGELIRKLIKENEKKLNSRQEVIGTKELREHRGAGS